MTRQPVTNRKAIIDRECEGEQVDNANYSSECIHANLSRRKTIITQSVECSRRSPLPNVIGPHSSHESSICRTWEPPRQKWASDAAERGFPPDPKDAPTGGGKGATVGKARTRVPSGQKQPEC